MTPQQLKAMKLALEALKWSKPHEDAVISHSEAITALEEALAEHAMRETQRLGQEIEQEPVIDKSAAKRIATVLGWEPKRKPLTDEEMKKIWYAMQNIMGWYSFQEIARAIEAAHGIRENT